MSAAPSPKPADPLAQQAKELLHQGRFSEWASNFQNDPNKAQRLAELRDSVDAVAQGERYEEFLKACYRVLRDTLKATPVQHVESEAQRVRHTLLEIFHRLPNNDKLRLYVREIIGEMMALLRLENETNAMLCKKIIIDMHKAYRSPKPGMPSLELEVFVQPLLDWILDHFQRLGETMRENFANPPPPPASADKRGKPPAPIPKSTHSFKLIADFPVDVVMICQIYGRAVMHKNIPAFLQVVLNALKAQAPPTAPQTHKSLFQDFITFQVRTLSFLAYILRLLNQDTIRKLQDPVPLAVLHLLRTCPAEATSTRKELLIAFRHILATEVKSGFLRHVDALLAEDVLIGHGRTAYETLRPIAHSTLADLVHHVRQQLSDDQLVKVIGIYSRNVHDVTLPFAIQTMSAKLLLNLVESIAKMKTSGFQLLMRVLDAFVNKFSSLKDRLPQLLKQTEIRNEQSDVVMSANVLKDTQVLMKTLMLGLKNLVWGLNSAKQQPALAGQAPPTRPRVPSLEECTTYRRLLRDGLRCCVLFQQCTDVPNAEKEVLENFSAVFAMFEPSIFYDVMASEMETVYNTLVVTPSVISFVQSLVIAKDVSKLMADVVLSFLVSKMGDLGGDGNEAKVMLFKVVFRASSNVPEVEAVLQPYIGTIVTESMRLTSQVKESANYFHLLRELFRSIASGKMNEYAKEFLPLLGTLLEGLNSLHESAHPPHMRELFVELSLRVPVRLSVLLPSLKLLMKPLILALETGGEICNHGLRLLEICLDKLGKDFLDNYFGDQKPRLMRALWKHLRPPPYRYAPQVLRILGKMAGRNRNFFISPLDLKTTEDTEPGYIVSMELVRGSQVEVPLQAAVSSAHFLRNVVASLLPVHADSALSVSDLTYGVHEGVALLDFVTFKEGSESRVKSVQRYKSEEGLLSQVLSAIFMASTQEQTKDAATKLTQSLATHFALLAIQQRDPNTAKLLEIGYSAFVDAVVDVAGQRTRDFSKAATLALDTFASCIETLCKGDRVRVAGLPVWNDLADRFCDLCRCREWHFKAGGVFGVGYLVNRLDVSWVRVRQDTLIDALFYVLRDLAPSISLSTIEEAAHGITVLMKLCTPKSDNSPEQQRHMDGVVSLLVRLLLSSNPRVRKNAQSALETLADITHDDVSAIIKPYLEEQLLTPIYAEPLSHHSRIVQTGFLDAITFCLNLRPPLLSVDEKLVSLIKTAFSIATHDDGGATGPRASQHVNERVVQRVVIIQLMAAAMALPEFNNAEELSQLRNDIICHFFDALTLRSEQIVSVAKKGLEQIVENTHISKELLRNSLRPILQYLQQVRTLSLPLLDGLARLLMLLRQNFNANLGEKLLEVLSCWSDPDKVAAVKAWKPNELAQIPVSIIELFHLLPSAGGSKFLDRLVHITMQLESVLPKFHLPRVLHSPYRTPLIKYLNLYAKEAVDFFLAHLTDVALRPFFAFILRSPEAQPLRDELRRNPKGIVDATFRANLGIDKVATKLELQCLGVRIVYCLARNNADILDEHPILLTALTDLWNDRQQQNYGELLTTSNLDEKRMLVRAFLIRCRAKPAESIDLLFEMLRIFVGRNTSDFSFLEEFYHAYLPGNYNTEQKREVLYRFFDFFRKSVADSNWRLASLAVQHVAVPLFRKVSCKPADIEMLTSNDMLVRLLGAPPPTPKEGEPIMPLPVGAPTSGILQTYPDASLDIELLKLFTNLINDYPNNMNEYRKILVQFAWDRLKSDDVTAQQSSYIFVCSFIKHYETPIKIILQIYYLLLRSHKPEMRGLVRESLDALLPFMHEKFMNMGPVPYWIEATRKVMNEEGLSSIPLMIHILKVVARHGTLFYPNREIFINAMISLIPKVALMPQSPPEQRLFALDLVDLMVTWEETRKAKLEDLKKDKKPEDGDGMDVDTPTPTSTTSTTPGQAAMHPGWSEVYTMPQPKVESMINFLIRLIAFDTRAENADSVGAQAERLFERVLSTWPNVLVRLEFFDRLLRPSPAPAQAPQNQIDQQQAHMTTGFKVIALTLQHQAQPFLEAYAGRIASSLPAALKIANDTVTGHIADIVGKVLSVYPDPTHPSVRDFYGKLHEAFGELMKLDPPPVGHLVTLLKSACEVQPEFLLKYCGPENGAGREDIRFINLIDKLVVEHLHADSLRTTQQANAQQAVDPKAPKRNEAYLWDCLSFVLPLIARLGPTSKKTLFRSILLLLERSTDEGILIKVLGPAREWVNEHMDLGVRAEYLNKVKRFQKVRSGELHNTFLELILAVYRHPNTTDDERANVLRSSVLIGLTSRSSTLRNEFYQQVNGEIPADLEGRIRAIFSPETWDQVGHVYFIQPALDLFFGLAPKDAALNLAALSSLVTPIKAGDVSGEAVAADEAIKALVAAHVDFLKSLRPLTASSFIDSLRHIYHHDMKAAHRIWIALFPALWSSLSSESQSFIQDSMQTLTSSPGLAKQARLTLNVFQTLLAGCERARQPRVEFPPSLLTYCARTYSCWHTSLRMLEGALINSLPHPSHTLASHLAHVYRGLNEDDYVLGVTAMQSVVEDTRAALAYEQLGLWPRAQQVLTRVQRDYENGVIADVPAWELHVWQSHWESACKRLNHWDVLCEYAKVNTRYDLLVQAAWKLGEWKLVREAFKQSGTQSDAPQTRLLQSFLALQENRIPEVDQLCKLAMNMLVLQWVGLPRYPGNSHVSTLQAFHKVIELYESAKVLKDLSADPRTRLAKLSDLRQNLQTWRLRMPNEWDDPLHWHDLLSWRQVIFDRMNEAYSNEADKGVKFLGHHEIAWSINKYAGVAKEHGLDEAAIIALRRIYTLPDIKIADAFMQLKVQLQCYLKHPAFYKTGLEVINGTNLDYFDKAQKAEFFHLKGEFQFRSGQVEACESSFATAVSLHHDFDEAWKSWGRYWDSAAHYGPTETRSENALHAMHAYMQAAKSSNHNSRKVVARVLWLLDEHALNVAAEENDTEEQPLEDENRSVKREREDDVEKEDVKRMRTEEGGNAGEEKKDSEGEKVDAMDIVSTEDAPSAPTQPTLPPPVPIPTPQQLPVSKDSMYDGFVRHVAQMPAWLWLAWLPELLDALSTPYARQARFMLVQAGRVHPHAVFYELNARIASLESADTSSQALGLAKEALELIRQSHPAVLSGLERLVKEMNSVAALTPLEELLDVLEQTMIDSHAMVHEEALTKVLRQRVKVACERALARDDNRLNTSCRALVKALDNAVNSRALFGALRNHVAPLKALLPRATQQLALFSPYLADFHADLLQVPAQYPFDQEPMSDEYAVVDKFEPTVITCGAGAGGRYRVLRIRTSAGDVKHFRLVHIQEGDDQAAQARQRSKWESEARLQDLRAHMNGVLRRHVQSRKRQLAFHVAPSVPLGRSARVVQLSEEHTSLWTVMTRRLLVSGIEPLDALVKATSDGFESAARLAHPTTLVNALTTILRNDLELVWLLKERLCGQLALHTLLTYAMELPLLLPWSTELSPKTACSSLTFEGYNIDGRLDRSDCNQAKAEGDFLNIRIAPVPYLLSNNVQYLLGPVGLSSSFVASQFAAASALSALDQHFDLRNLSQLLFKHDLTSITNLDAQAIRKATVANSDILLQRVNDLVPPTTPGSPVLSTVPITHRIQELLNHAVSPNNLQRVDPTFFPWF